MVAATIRKIHAPNQLAAVFEVSGSPDENFPYTFTPPISPTTAPMAYISLVPGSKYELTIEVASLMPAMPFPCAKAEAVAAIRSAADRISFCLLFLFINCSCFVPSKGWMVLYRAVDTRLLFFGLVGCPFVSTDLGVSVADRTCLALPRRMGVILHFHYHFFFRYT